MLTAEQLVAAQKANVETLLLVANTAFASAERLADELNRALAEGQGRAERLRDRLPAPEGKTEQAHPAAVVASPHANSLILAGSAAQVLELKRLDPGLPVVLMSGYHHQDVLARLEGEVPAGFLLKPSSLSDVVNVTRKALGLD